MKRVLKVQVAVRHVSEFLTGFARVTATLGVSLNWTGLSEGRWRLELTGPSQAVTRVEVEIRDSCDLRAAPLEGAGKRLRVMLTPEPAAGSAYGNGFCEAIVLEQKVQAGTATEEEVALLRDWWSGDITARNEAWHRAGMRALFTEDVKRRFYILPEGQEGLAT
ncbi:MAG: hypothetical protein HYZ53_20810 [Planctomycetes bacterium]|nr:hypothetical protein [Planctomycetota bacterium]